MRDLLQEFLGSCRGRSLSLSTCVGYDRIGQSWLQWFRAEYGRDATLPDWTRKVAAAYLASLVDARLKQTTRRRNIASLRSWANWLVEKGHCQANPWEGLKTPVNEELRQPCPTEEQVRALFDACDRMPNRRRGAMTKAALALMALAGLRMCEVIAVRVADVDLEVPPRRVRVNWGKGGKSGSVRLNSLACAIIADWLAIRPATDLPNLLYLHGDKRGDRAYTVSAFGLALISIKAIAKLDSADITAHALRRFAATSLAQQRGATIADVQHFLRHTAPEVTLRYIKGSLSRQSEFVEGIMSTAPAPIVKQPPPPADNRGVKIAEKRRPTWRRQ